MQSSKNYQLGGKGKQQNQRIEKSVSLAKDYTNKLDKANSLMNSKVSSAKVKKNNSVKGNSTKWTRTGEGWYVGSNGLEIIKSSSGYDVVDKNYKTIKSYKTLNEAKMH